VRRVAPLILAVLALVPAAAAAKSNDSLAPPDAPPHWLPPEPWVYNHWIPYDEGRLYALLHITREQLWQQLRDDHRRRGGQIVRIHDVEQRLREAGELGVELELHARGEKRHALDQPLDVGIADLEVAHAEPRRNLRKLIGEFGAHLAQMPQLDVVILEQSRIHHTTRVGRRSAIWTFPVSRSNSVRTSNSSGTGCAHSSL
jgi:hypothetical protein